MQQAHVVAFSALLSALVPFSSGAGAQTSSSQATAFQEMQADMGVATFIDVCADALPDFASTSARMEAMGATLQGGSYWLGGGALIVSVQTHDGRQGCVATIAGTTQNHVVRHVTSSLNDRFGGFDLRVAGGAPRAFITTPSGPAVVTIVPFEAGVHLLIQAEPN